MIASLKRVYAHPLDKISHTLAQDLLSIAETIAIPCVCDIRWGGSSYLLLRCIPIVYTVYMIAFTVACHGCNRNTGIHYNRDFNTNWTPAASRHIALHGKWPPDKANDFQKFVFIAPKAHLHSSAKDGPRVPWIFCCSRSSRFSDFWEFLIFFWWKTGASPSIQTLPLAL